MTEHPQTDLSERELDILRLVATGASNKEVAYQLSISANTVKVHLRNIFAKIGVASRTEAAMYAVKMGVVTTREVATSVDDLADEEIVPMGAGEFVEAPEIDRRRPMRIAWLLVSVGIVLLLALVTFVAIWWSRTQQPSATPTDSNFVLPLESTLERWQARANMPTARVGCAMVAYENQIYTIAGRSEAGVTGTVEQYDPATDQWHTGLPPKPNPVKDVGAVVLGGKIYIPGGITASGEVTSTMDVYDFQQQTWKQAAPLPAPLSAYAIAAFEGRFYVFGGWDGQDFVDTVWMYSPEQDAWEARADLPAARGYVGAVTVANKIFVLGGYDGEIGLTDNWIYLPERNDEDPWEQKAALPQDYRDMGVASVADAVYVFGGGGAAQRPLAFLMQPGAWQELDLPPDDKSLQGSTRMVQVGEYLYILRITDEAAPAALHLAYRAIYTVQIPVIINK